jgi:tRNA-dihydrouridine synthase
MNKDKIVRKVLAKLNYSSVNPSALNSIIEAIKENEGEEFLYNLIYRFFKKLRTNEQDAQDIFERFIKKEKLHEISDAHKGAFKKLLDGEFSFVELKV